METQVAAVAAAPKFVGVRSLDMKSVLALPSVGVVVTKSSRKDKRTQTVSDSYSADLDFDFATKYHFVLTGNQYGILVTIQTGHFVPEQFRATAKVRITRFDWGRNDQGKQRCTYMVEVYFSPLLVLSFRLQANDPFVVLLLLRLSKGVLGKEYAPVAFDGTALGGSDFEESLKAAAEAEAVSAAPVEQ
jgi:hypothetical protein